MADIIDTIDDLLADMCLGCGDPSGANGWCPGCYWGKE